MKNNAPKDISLVLPRDEYLEDYDEIEEFYSPSQALEFFFTAVGTGQFEVSYDFAGFRL